MNFDKKYGYGVFEHEEFIEICEELEKFYPEPESKNSEEKVKKEVDKVEENDDKGSATKTFLEEETDIEKEADKESESDEERKSRIAKMKARLMKNNGLNMSSGGNKG